MRLFSTAIAALLVSGLGACGGGDDEATSDCVQLSQASLDAISHGLKFSGAEVTKGQAVELAEDEKEMGIEYVAAVGVTDRDGEETVTYLGLDSVDQKAGPSSIQTG